MSPTPAAARLSIAGVPARWPTTSTGGVSPGRARTGSTPWRIRRFGSPSTARCMHAGMQPPSIASLRAGGRLMPQLELQSISIHGGDEVLRVVPITITAAKEYIRKHHRHNVPPVGALFACAAESDGVLVGVATVGRPVARMLADGKTCEVTRCCTDGTHNACSILYGACRRAAKALGYSRIVTYTLESESGTSLLASGWSKAGMSQGGAWSRPSRSRKSVAPECPKQRWECSL